MFFLVLSILLSVLAIFYSSTYSFFYWISIIFVLFGLLMSLISDNSFELQNIVWFFVFLYVLFCFIITILQPKSDKILYFHIHNNKLFKKFLFLGHFFSVLSIFAYFYSAGGINGIVKSWVVIATSRDLYQLIFANLSQVFLIISLSNYFFYFIKTFKLHSIFFSFILVLVFLILTRSKAYLLPLILPYMLYYFYGYKNNILKLLSTGFLISISGVILYLFTTVVRWSGDFSELSSEKILNTYESVLSSGVERNLYFQFKFIFNHYLHNDLIFMQTYFSMFNPLLKLLSIDTVENPMYLYNNIIYGGSGLMKGSAHPTIFADSFANLGFLGVFVGGLHLVFLRFIRRLFCKNDYLFFSFIVCLSYSVPLIIRGSVYYGFLYLFIALISLLTINFLLRLRWNINVKF